MPINNNHFDNFYINSVFTQNTNSGFVARSTRSFPSARRCHCFHTQDQPGSAVRLCPLCNHLVYHEYNNPDAVGGRVVEYPSSQPANRVEFQSVCPPVSCRLISSPRYYMSPSTMRQIMGRKSGFNKR